MDSSSEARPGGGEVPLTPASHEITPVAVSHPVRPDGGAASQRAYQAEHEALADERQALADERDRLADEREALADEREALADDRERFADERERDADDREMSLDERARRLGARVLGAEERALEHLNRSRALLGAQAERLDRQEAELRRRQAFRARDDHTTIRATAADQWDEPVLDPCDPAQQAEALMRLARAALTAFARTAEEIARRHDQAAASGTGPVDEHRLAAERAREAIRRSGEIIRDFGG